MNKQESIKAVCWDLDETVGVFDQVPYEMRKLEVPDWERPTVLRYGMRELLQDFSEINGFIHFITTSGTERYGKFVLRKTKLTKFFRKVFGRDSVVGVYDGKQYKPVAREIGFTEEDMRGRMIAIGNSPNDQPADIDMVFIHIGNNERMDALVIREILVSLLENGDGHFKKGFEKLYAETIPQYPERIQAFQARMYNLGNGITFEMVYQGEHGVFSGEKIVPVITSIVAPGYEREPVPVKTKKIKS